MNMMYDTIIFLVRNCTIEMLREVLRELTSEEIEKALEIGASEGEAAACLFLDPTFEPVWRKFACCDLHSNSSMRVCVKNALRILDKNANI